MNIPPNEVLNDFLINQRREVKAALMLIASELCSAERKHPAWPTDAIHAAAIVNEESGELVRAALQFTYERHEAAHMQQEAIQTGAVALRFVMRYGAMLANPSLQTNGLE